MQDNLVRGPLKKVGIRCPILPRPLCGRLLSSRVLANGEGRGADIVENCRLMRRDAARSASLRTGSIIRGFRLGRSAKQILR